MATIDESSRADVSLSPADSMVQEKNLKPSAAFKQLVDSVQVLHQQLEELDTSLKQDIVALEAKLANLRAKMTFNNQLAVKSLKSQLVKSDGQSLVSVNRIVDKLKQIDETIHRLQAHTVSKTGENVQLARVLEQIRLMEIVEPLVQECLTINTTTGTIPFSVQANANKMKELDTAIKSLTNSLSGVTVFQTINANKLTARQIAYF